MTLKNLSGVTKNGVKTAELAPNLKVDKEGKKCNCHQRISDLKKLIQCRVEWQKDEEIVSCHESIMQLTNTKLSVLGASNLMVRCKMLRV